MQIESIANAYTSGPVETASLLLLVVLQEQASCCIVCQDILTALDAMQFLVLSVTYLQ